MLRALAALLGVAGLVTVLVPLPTGARIQPQAPFVDGSGTARATALGLAPRTGGLSYAVTTGETLASYQGTEGRAEAQALDLGVLGLLLTTVSACGQPPLLKPDQVPGPVQANSSHGPATVSRSLAGGDLVAGGVQTATAHSGSSAADAAAAVLALPGVLSVAGATSHADTRLVPGRLREAHAEASVASVDLAGGLVQLRGLHWDVTQHTGTAPARAGSFHVDEVLVGGGAAPAAPAGPLGGLAAPLPPTPASLDQANTVLAPLGIHLAAPQVRTAPDGTVEVDPLRISLGGATQLSKPLGAALAAAQPGRDALAGLLKGDPQNCADPRSSLGPLAGAGMLLADIAGGGLTGTGGADVLLGGVHATTEGIAYGSPFGDLGVPPALPAAAGAPPGSAPPPPGGGSLPPPPAAAPAAPAATVPPVGGRTVSACVGGTPAHPGGCVPDAARAAAAGGLAVAVLLFAADAALMRRRPRRARAPR
jgi:hypothetical protein